MLQTVPSPQVEARAPSWVLVLHCVSAYLILTCLHHQTLPREQGPGSCTCTLSPPVTEPHMRGALGQDGLEGKEEGREEEPWRRKAKDCILRARESVWHRAPGCCVSMKRRCPYREPYQYPRTVSGGTRMSETPFPPNSTFQSILGGHQKLSKMAKSSEYKGNFR